MQERSGSSTVVMEVVSQWGSYVILCQDRARKLGSNNVVMVVVYHWDSYVIL